MMREPAPPTPQVVCLDPEARANGTAEGPPAAVSGDGPVDDAAACRADARHGHMLLGHRLRDARRPGASAQTVTQQMTAVLQWLKCNKVELVAHEPAGNQPNMAWRYRAKWYEQAPPQWSYSGVARHKLSCMRMRRAFSGLSAMSRELSISCCLVSRANLAIWDLYGWAGLHHGPVIQALLSQRDAFATLEIAKPH